MRVGQHEVEVEAPDFIVLHMRGELLASDAEVFGKLFEAHARGGRVFVLSLIESDAFTMGVEARKTFIEAIRRVPLIVDAVVGASFHNRVLGKLVATAARVLAGRKVQVGFFDDEQSARVWLRDEGCVACGATSGPDRSSGSS